MYALVPLGELVLFGDKWIDLVAELWWKAGGHCSLPRIGEYFWGIITVEFQHRAAI